MLMLALLLLNCSKIMLERNLWSSRLRVKNVGRFSKQIVTLNYVIVAKERRIDYLSNRTDLIYYFGRKAFTRHLSVSMSPGISCPKQFPFSLSMGL